MNETEELTIHRLLNEYKYIIPYYQRNYAWGFLEINQLLSDIRDSIDKPSDSEKSYYLGTLVVAKRISHGEIFYEIVDGQQRHTTLSIIHAVLNEKKSVKRNLYFEARKENEDALDIMFGQKESNEFIGSGSFYSAKQVIEQFLNEINIESFREFFYKNLKIFRVVLPVETDLNHYFEVMNNRGEQLEQHEILKARLMDKITDAGLQHIFSVIWDACSDMNGFVIQKTQSDYRKILYGEDYAKIPTLENILSFKSNSVENKEDLSENEKWNFDEILKEYFLESNFNQQSTTDEDFRFSSVIDFSNFLLQVKKLSNSDVKLDDKFLLKEFDDVNTEKTTLEFILSLLKTRILFDNYIIKRDKGENNWSWSLLRYTNESNHPYKFSLQNMEVGKSLKMIQSMFHVTFTSNNYKNWLFDSVILLRQYHNDDLIDGKSFLKHLHNKAIERFKENENIYQSGLNTPRFVFNFIDYLLWKEYFDSVRGNQSEDHDDVLLDRISKLKQKFYSFKFVQRSSIEHLFPQSRIAELNEATESEKNIIMNCLGNLCLISKSVNSSLNNHLPYQKKNDSLLRNTNESLKQLIMFETFNNEIWNIDEIKKHHQEIINLLEKYGCLAQSHDLIDSIQDHKT